VSGILWVGLSFYPAECAPPTEVTEDFCNRLIAPPLLGMLAGFAALFADLRTSLTRTGAAGLLTLLAGMILMIAGNVVEYWFLTDLPHEGPDGWARGVAFMTVLLGLALVLLASTAFGIATLRAGRAPRIVAAAFVVLLPLSIVTGMLQASLFALPLGILSAVAGLAALTRKGRLAAPLLSTRRLALRAFAYRPSDSSGLTPGNP
jgi:hypothetical protein